MAVLNLRNVPEDLMRRLRAAAAIDGHPFHAFCVRLLESGLEDACPSYSKLPPIRPELLSNLKNSLSETPAWTHPGSRPEKEILQNRAQIIPEIIPEPPSDEPLETRIT
jgi:hypothetical protein